MTLYLMLAVVFGIPLATLIWAIISFILFLRTPKDHPKRKSRTILFAVSASIAIVLPTLLIVLVFCLFMSAIMYM